MSWKFRLRVVFPLFLTLSILLLGYGYVTASTTSTFEQQLDDRGVSNPHSNVAPPSEGITVIATDSNSWLGERREGPRARAELVAFQPNGTVLYYNDSHTRYWDVDPVSNTTATVEYAFADHLDASACPTEWNATQHGIDQQTWDKYYAQQRDTGACTRNGFERINLSTGGVTTVWSLVTPGKPGTRYHDIDRLNKTHLIVADIYLDRVFVVNAETARIEWTWNASDAFDPTHTGGPYPDDWSHINDVEVLEDGRIMVSSRNHDQVVFLNRSGIVAGWTLGEENNHEILHEQHNPDFIPPHRGGPAVLGADSENNRVIEYQRIDGMWQRSWGWRDARLQWPRDADRLPNGHTLITDSNGNRVFEVNQDGEVVWSLNIAFPYEAERLGTGDESTGGYSAAQLGILSRTPPLDESVWIAMKGLLPKKYLNGLMYITPVWMGFPELFATIVGGLWAFIWGVTEFYWAFIRRVSVEAPK